MLSIKNFIYSEFGGTFVMANILLLVLIAIIISSTLRKKPTRFLFSFLASLFIVLQLSSLSFVKTFIGYRFYVHFNIRDVLTMLDIYMVQLLYFVALQALLVFLIYQGRVVIDRIFNFFSKANLHSIVQYGDKNIPVFKLFVIASSFIFMSFKGGVIDTSLNLISLLNTDTKNFIGALDDAGMDDYVMPNEIKATKGKNIIVLSLESFEKGYLSDKLKSLTPNLSSYKKDMAYYNLKPNWGSGWTSGSLYTFLSGFPAGFGLEGNSIFQTAYHSNISGVSHVLKKAGYDMTFLTTDAQFSGTQEMLKVFGIDNVLDQTVLGGEPRDMDLFSRAKLEVKKHLGSEKPFFLFVSTLDTHGPNGLYDKRMEGLVPDQDSNLKFMVSSVDYLVGDFMDYLEDESALDNTIIYILPDHLKMGNTAIFDGTGERGLFLLSNANERDISSTDADSLYQVDLPKMILEGAGIKHNVKFFSDYIPDNVHRGKFIYDNAQMITTINTAGLLRTENQSHSHRMSSL